MIVRISLVSNPEVVTSLAAFTRICPIVASAQLIETSTGMTLGLIDSGDIDMCPPN